MSATPCGHGEKEEGHAQGAGGAVLGHQLQIVAMGMHRIRLNPAPEDRP